MMNGFEFIQAIQGIAKNDQQAYEAIQKGLKRELQVDGKDTEEVFKESLLALLAMTFVRTPNKGWEFKCDGLFSEMAWNTLKRMFAEHEIYMGRSILWVESIFFISKETEDLADAIIEKVNMLDLLEFGFNHKMDAVIDLAQAKELHQKYMTYIAENVFAE